MSTSAICTNPESFWQDNTASEGRDRDAQTCNEDHGLAPDTINGRLAAVRRLACEAADGGLLSPGLAAGIRRVKGVKNPGVRIGNWLTADQGVGWNRQMLMA
jgi:hypothetical protein